MLHRANRGEMPAAVAERAATAGASDRDQWL